jgi:hypothetical protein
MKAHLICRLTRSAADRPALAPCTTCATTQRVLDQPNSYVMIEWRRGMFYHRKWCSRGELADGELSRWLASDFVIVYSSLMTLNRSDLAGFGRFRWEVKSATFVGLQYYSATMRAITLCQFIILGRRFDSCRGRTAGGAGQRRFAMISDVDAVRCELTLGGVP